MIRSTHEQIPLPLSSPRLVLPTKIFSALQCRLSVGSQKIEIVMSGVSGVLYHHCFSPPSRMALLTIRNLGLNIQIKNIDIYKGEQNSPQYLKINPLNQVPAYVEGNFMLAESKAIATYLANSSKSFLYPTDCKKRALIDAKLYYDTANSLPAVRNFVVRDRPHKMSHFLCHNVLQIEDLPKQCDALWGQSLT